MTLIDGIGDEVVHFFIGLIVVIVVAWWTTSISEQRHIQTVWFLDRRRHRTHRRLTNHTHAVTIAEGTLTPVQTSLGVGDGGGVSSATNQIQTVVQGAEVKPPEPGDGDGDGDDEEEDEEEEAGAIVGADEDNDEEAIVAGTSNSGLLLSSAADFIEDERSRIVEVMDSEASVLRQRRIAFYERSNENFDAINNIVEEPASEHIMEHNYAERSPNSETVQNQSTATHEDNPRNSTSDIRIRLKYINDDLKLVDGNLHEQLGDFKKRHFHGEMSNNKLIRLIFNGQVLHQDTQTLERCGFFDNCVVHCLIHQRRPTPGEENIQENRGDNINGNSNNRNGAGNNNQGRDWDLGNFLFALITFTLLSAWYFRYIYAHMYNVTATVGLIMLTGFFTVIFFGFYLPDQDNIPQRVDESPAHS